MTEAEPRDEGLQVERSVLAWHRTLLSLVVMFVVVARVALGEGRAWTSVMALVGAVVVLVTFLPFLGRRTRALSSGPEIGYGILLREGRAPVALAGLMGVVSVTHVLLLIWA